MRGPGYRHDLDVRRTWRCPACRRERKVPGDVTQVRCGCQPQGTWMELVGERTVPPRPPSMVSLPEQSVASFNLTEEELARPVEGRIRRRPFGRFAPEGGPPDANQQQGGDAPANQGPPPGRPERPNRPRPDRRPKPEKRPLSDLEHFGEAMPPKAEAVDVNPAPVPPPTPAPPPTLDDGFGAGLEDSSR